MGLGDLARRSSTDEKAELAAQFYAHVEDYINERKFNQPSRYFDVQNGHQLEVVVKEIIPDNATELKEGGFYIHVHEVYYKEEFYTNNNLLSLFYVINTDSAGAVEPSGRKISHNAQ